MDKSTIVDVAKLANVSVSTVSRVVNGNYSVSAETAKKVKEAVDILGYSPNIIARSMKNRRTGIIGVILQDIGIPFYGQFLKGVETLTESAGYNLMIASTYGDITKEKQSIDMFLDKQIEGLIILARQTDKKNIKELCQKVPVVFFGRRIDGVSVNLVYENNVEASYSAVTHLLSMGHRKVAVLNGPMNIITSADRFEGYKEALRNNGIPFDNKYAIDASVVTSQSYDDVVNSVKKQIQSYSRIEQPTAYYTTNSFRMELLLRVLNELKLTIPDDVSLVSYGEVLTSNLLPFKITHISQDHQYFGKKCAEIILKMIKNPEDNVVIEHVVRSTLTLGSSVKKI